MRHVIGPCQTSLDFVVQLAFDDLEDPLILDTNHKDIPEPVKIKVAFVDRFGNLRDVRRVIALVPVDLIKGHDGGAEMSNPGKVIVNDMEGQEVILLDG